MEVMVNGIVVDVPEL